MDIVGYDGYIIYDDGKVYSKISKKFLKQHIDGPGYHFVTLRYEKGKYRPVNIHKLVALHYIPNTDNKPCIDHINRDKLDNRKINLRWVTYSENMLNRNTKYNSGHNWIGFNNHKKKWIFKMKSSKERAFKNKIDCICWKFIYIYWLNHL